MKRVGIALLLLAAEPSLAFAGPLERVSSWLADGARIAQQNDREIRVIADGLERELVIGDAPGPRTDIWFATVERRRQNPYRVWYIDRGLLKNPDFPKAQWPRFLKVDFLRVLKVGDKSAR